MNGDDPIETLLRASGARRPAPSEREERSRAAVERHWRRTGAIRRWRRRAVAGLAVVAAAAAVFLLRAPTAPPPETGARVELVAGELLRLDSSQGAAASPTPLLPGQEIRTGERIEATPGSRAAIRLISGHSVRLDSGTRVHLSGAGELQLDSGAVYVDSGPTVQARSAASPGTRVRTPRGTIEEAGTQFEARLVGDGLTVRVREGRVAIRGPGLRETVATGEEIAIDASDAVTRRPLSPAAAEWDWIEGVTPPVALEGLTLLDFLAWTARERGLELEFSPPALRGSATSTRLSGSIDGMTLDEALTSVIATTGFEASLQGGRLVVTPATGGTD